MIAVSPPMLGVLILTTTAFSCRQPCFFVTEDLAIHAYCRTVADDNLLMHGTAVVRFDRLLIDTPNDTAVSFVSLAEIFAGIRYVRYVPRCVGFGMRTVQFSSALKYSSSGTPLATCCYGTWYMLPGIKYYGVG